MWTVVSWPLRSRLARRVALLALGLLVRRRVADVRAAVGWTGDEDEVRRAHWRWLLPALGLTGLTAALALRARQRADGAGSHAVSPRASSAAADAPVKPPEPAPVVAPPTPELDVANPSAAPGQPDLVAGEAALGRSLAVDDLKIVDGIGPKIEQLLNDNGVRTWHDLSVADVDRLRAILHDAGARYRMHDPSAWPTQATLLVRGDWEAFAAQDGDD